MTDAKELAATAKAIVDSNRYMTLATADESGVPWASPVWYATEDYRAFFWVSSAQARHSRNVAARPHVGIVIFDSQVPGGTGQGVYLSAAVQELAAAELDDGIVIFILGPGDERIPVDMDSSTENRA